MIVVGLRYLALCCGLRSTPEDLVQVNVVPCAVNFLWPYSQFSGCKIVILKLQSPMRYHTFMSNIAKCRFCLFLLFLLESIEQSPEISLAFLVYNLMATLLDCMQTDRGQCPLLLNTYDICWLYAWFTVP